MNIKESVKQDFILLGKHIKKLRESEGLSIKELSIKTGISSQYLRKIENGLAYRVLIDKHLFKIAIALNVKMQELFSFI